MAMRRSFLIAAAAMGVLIGGSWLTWSLLARQGQGTLSQVPLNIQTPTPPAFIMALDDSPSMIWEVLNNTRDGVYRWVENTGGGRRIGFYDNGGTPYGYGEGSGQNYYFLTPNYTRSSESAIPPFDVYGFARSPDINGAYFDPRDVYPTWKTGYTDATRAVFKTIDPAAAPVDPRPSGTPAFKNYTINLTEDSWRIENGWRYQLRAGMVIPVGTMMEDLRNAGTNQAPAPRCGMTSANTDGSGARSGWRRVSTAITLTAACDAAISFYPATFFLTEPSSLPASFGYRATPVAVTTGASPNVGGRPGTIYKYEIRPDNFSSTEQYTAAMQNFANWFSFYRVRREAVIGAATNALQDASNLRVGWFRINGRPGNAASVKMYDMSNETEKVTLLDNIIRDMRASGSTPNRSAVSYMGTLFKREKSAADPNPPILQSCQKNAGMLFTDGYTNETGNKTLMSALAKPLYDNSLVPSLETNGVPVPAECSGPSPDPSLDCNRKLHMNFYGVTLGTLGNRFGVVYKPKDDEPWIIEPNPYTVGLGNLGLPTQWNSELDLKPAAVDELWGAVLATKGEMVNATRPSQITLAMRRIISNVSQGATPSGTRSLTGARIGTGSLAVEPFYEATNNGTDWYSRLTAYSLAVGDNRGISNTRAWEASEELPAAADRKVWFWRDGALLRFNSSNVALADLCSKPEGLYRGMALCSTAEITTLAANADNAVAYLLGETAREVRNGGALRDRTTRLGDIINSTPALSSPTDDYGYRRLPGDLGTSYATWLTSKRNDARYMVYAGANDGMLHAFDGGMGADGRQDDEGGKEKFAYVPATSLGHMGNLLLPYKAEAGNNQRFDHRYYVDGPVTVGDIHNGTAWSTALVGTAGAGGRSVFALDVSNPSGFDENSLLWELNDVDTQLSSTVRDNLGHVLGKPVIVPVRGSDGSTHFKAIFGNGYESRSGKAALYVVDMVAGRPPTISVRIAEEQGQDLPAGSNGLGNIVVVDRWSGDRRGRDGYADTVYAADQKGAIWKFDLRSDAAPTRPLFTTRTHVHTDNQTYRQPIMGGLVATTGASGGVMLLFGTGSFAYQEDGRDESVQGLYGVNDIDNGQPSATLTAANLREITVTEGEGTRSLEMGTMPSDGRGWNVVLPAKERMVGNPSVVAGVVFMPTYVPDQAVGCSVDGSNWLFGLMASSGAPALGQVRLGSPTGSKPGAGTAAVALSTGGNAPVRDVTASIVPREKPAEPDEDEEDTNPPEPPEHACLMNIGVPGAEPMYVPYPCGRQSWRQIQ